MAYKQDVLDTLVLVLREIEYNKATLGPRSTVEQRAERILNAMLDAGMVVPERWCKVENPEQGVTYGGGITDLTPIETSTLTDMGNTWETEDNHRKVELPDHTKKIIDAPIT